MRFSGQYGEGQGRFIPSRWFLTVPTIAVPITIGNYRDGIEAHRAWRYYDQFRVFMKACKLWILRTKY